MEAAAEVSRAMLEANDKFAPAHYNLGLALRAMNDVQDAERHFQRAKELGYVVGSK
jgi:tetratricopeptide (TPR) repeat protein